MIIYLPIEVEKELPTEEAHYFVFYNDTPSKATWLKPDKNNGAIDENGFTSTVFYSGDPGNMKHSTARVTHWLKRLSLPLSDEEIGKMAEEAFPTQTPRIIHRITNRINVLRKEDFTAALRAVRKMMEGDK